MPPNKIWGIIKSDHPPVRRSIRPSVCPCSQYGVYVALRTIDLLTSFRLCGFFQFFCHLSGLFKQKISRLNQDCEDVS